MIEFFTKYKTILKFILLALVIAAIGNFIWHTNFNEIVDYLKKMPFTFVGLIIMSFSAYMMATLSWKLCLDEHDDKVSLWNLFMMRHVGEMLTVYNPTSIVAGEGLKIFYLEKNNVPRQAAVSAIFLSRILLILSAIFLMILSLLYLFSKVLISTSGLVMIIIVALVVGLFGYLLARFLIHSNLYLSRLLIRLQKRFGKKIFSDTLIESGKEVNQACHLFYKKNKGKFLLGFLFSLLHWILGAAEFYLIIKVLGVDISFINAIAIESGVILFKTIGAIVPGQIGVEEYANKIMLESVGVHSNEIWLVVSIMRRARQIFWLAVATLFHYFIKRSYSKGIVVPENLTD